ncbi:MAG: energy transducer TonB [Verrucomicrobia bacterium]|nr:energy transducer TonB [Verrucomicrobiota bacterium]
MTGRRSVVVRFFAEQPVLAAMIIVALALHVGAGMLFQVQAGTAPMKKPVEPRVVFIGIADETALGMAAIRDPSLTALPSRHGFSAWTLASGAPTVHQTPAIAQTPRPLAKRPESPAPPAPPMATGVNDSLLGRVSPASQETEMETVPLAATQVAITGPVAARARPSLTAHTPRIEGLAPAQATVLRVAADNLGRVRYSLVEESSGSVAADRKAVELVKGWQFTPRDGIADALDWGEVRILWAGGGEAAPTATPSPAIPAATPGAPVLLPAPATPVPPPIRGGANP